MKTITVLLSLMLLTSAHAQNTLAQDAPLSVTVNLSPAQSALGQTVKVDWNNQVITVEGAATTRAGLSQAQAYVQGRAAAMADAQRLLGVALTGLRVDAQTTVKDFEFQSDSIQTKLSAIVKGQVEGDPRVQVMGDGSSIVFVKMSAPLGSALNLLEELKPKLPVPHITVKVTRVINVVQYPAVPVSPISGLIIDARRVGFVPCLLPRFYSDDGTLRWNYNVFMTREGGVSGYASSVQAAREMIDRGGRDALVVEAVAADRCNIVISSAEADALSRYDRVSGFLNDFNVTIVF